ncbi:hypothetical protein J9B83_04430 [Marinomonas sp. A79]|uniref:Outer membrane protein beta-barrel domain-containing protein n=1 Tax=Marinomonas vulgaris TaxID=2823372 RepID=A0ABS5H909_9GAMM|nr:hypothetical protein [Marinomonas vulgaris]MBR7888181.1 hypothetical protein [Marinomonas vulgaris]
MNLRKKLALGCVAMAAVSYTGSALSAVRAQVGVGLFDELFVYKNDSLEANLTGYSLQVRTFGGKHFASDFGIQKGNSLEATQGNISVKVDGYESTALYFNWLLTTEIQPNLAYGYLGLGLFHDTLEYNDLSYTATGLQIPIGIGYQFQRFAVEYQLQFRSADDYSSSLESVDVGTLSLLLAF